MALTSCLADSRLAGSLVIRGFHNSLVRSFALSPASRAHKNQALIRSGMDVKNVITLLTPYRASILTKPSSRSTGRAGLAHTDSEDCAEITVPCARNSTRRRGPVVEALLTPYPARP